MWENGEYVYYIIKAGASVNITDIHYDENSSGATNYTLTKAADVSDGESYLVNNGNTYGAKGITINKALSGALTLTPFDIPYGSLLKKPTADGYILSSTVAGNQTWIPYTAVATITSAATLSINAALANNFVLTLANNITSFANPTNLTTGQTLTIKIVQGSGPYTIASGVWGSTGEQNPPHNGVAVCYYDNKLYVDLMPMFSFLKDD
jgi:hypothetical protein